VDFPGNLTIGEIVRQRASQYEDHEYLVFENAGGTVEIVSYRQLEARSNAIANGLTALGLVKGDRLVLMLPNSVEFVLATIGAAKIGVVTVPVNTASAEGEIRQVFSLAEPAGYITHGSYAPLLASVAATAAPAAAGIRVGEAGPELSLTGWASLLRAGDEPPDIAVFSDDLLQLMMTSGTTARPKAVMHTHANRIRSGYRVTLTCRLTCTDRSLSAFPAFHVNCLDGTLMAALVSGGTAVLLERFSGTRFWDQVRRHRATCVPLLPTVIRALLAKPPSAEDRDHCVRYVGTGLHLSSEELGAFGSRFGIGAITTGYGLTEAVTGVLSTPLEGEQRHPSIGVPLFDRVVELRGADGQPAGVGEVGEITVQGVPGRTLMLGYYRDPGNTRLALRDGWLHTGDLARQDEKGYFYFVGRSKDMIKRSGENIAAQEVEAVLAEHPDIVEAAVIGVPDPYRDEAVKAYLIVSPGAVVDLGAVRSCCAGKLADFKIPTQIEIVDDLPRGLIGKVDKNALRERNAEMNVGEAR
jgi:crotonobetaine/carnitine-CoA ligase